MRVMRYLLPLLVLTGWIRGDEGTPDKSAPPGAVQKIRVELKAVVPDEKTKIEYSKPKPMVVERTVPRFVFEVPKFKAKDPLFFRIKLGETKGIPFYAALDRSPETGFYDSLYIDLDRDLDLTNDGEPIKAKLSTMAFDTKRKLAEFLELDLPLSYTIDGKEVKENYRCAVFFFIEGKDAPLTVQVERDSWREGTVSIGGKDYIAAVLDDDSDGQYSTGDSWVLRPVEKGREGLMSIDATRSMLFPAWSEDQKLTAEVASVDPAGRFATLEIGPAKETEREFFVRVARQRQTPEERQLDIDPLRPKAAATEKVQWIAGQDIEYARDIAAKVKKRVLIDFFGRRCVWCRRMNLYSFRDREIVELCKRFVCIKMEWKEGTPLARKWDVGGTPTYLVLEPDGTEVARQPGFQKPSLFAGFLKSALR